MTSMSLSVCRLIFFIHSCTGIKVSNISEIYKSIFDAENGLYSICLVFKKDIQRTRVHQGLRTVYILKHNYKLKPH